RMFDDCHEEHNKRNSSMYRWQFPLRVLKEQQAIIDQLNSVLEEGTKEWLQAIELGTYFENVAKPLKEENNRLKAQLNDMEVCYIKKKKQLEEALVCVDQAKDGYYGFSNEGGDTDNLVKDLEKALRGAND